MGRLSMNAAMCLKSLKLSGIDSFNFAFCWHTVKTLDLIARAEGTALINIADDGDRFRGHHLRARQEASRAPAMGQRSF